MATLRKKNKFKLMVVKKGEKIGLGNKGGGRKTKREELKTALENLKEEITTEALIKLANNKVYKFLNQANEFQKVKDMGLPITLKGIAEKINVNTKLELSFDSAFNDTPPDTKKNSAVPGKVQGD